MASPSRCRMDRARLALKLPRPSKILVVVPLLTLGCGTQSDADIPPELLEALRQRNGSDSYPPGPTGGEEGDIATNICFSAWENPQAQTYDPAALAERCLADYWDPEAKTHQLLFVVSAAIWCQSCQVEFGGAGAAPALSVELAQRYDAGLRALGGLFQNAQGEPATTADAVRWARTFSVDFPFGVDADFTLGRFAKADAQPLHMLVDTSTMRIVYKSTGGDIALLWERVDDWLDRESSE